jgi:hypothetical protein
MSRRKLFSAIAFAILLGSACQGATVTGIVKGPDGAPFQGAFVEARNMKMRMTVIVLSDTQGRYRLEKLPPGEYRVQIDATGYAPIPVRALTSPRTRTPPSILLCNPAWSIGTKLISIRPSSSGPRRKGRT